ncbi:hypothetical protein BRADI_2g45433v3 [Brachypodium distachyon]|uniref:Uncharacterized protein n=1 Tax=Brachypodium distachyon TaxID=15368 RepID=A0A2K2DE17_BRADI|nr:hypothetical protein BRADI_2g45433v3 [Brachypodium distachyon]
MPLYPFLSSVNKVALSLKKKKKKKPIPTRIDPSRPSPALVPPNPIPRRGSVAAAVTKADRHGDHPAPVTTPASRPHHPPPPPPVATTFRRPPPPAAVIIPSPIPAHGKTATAARRPKPTCMEAESIKKVSES